VCGRSRGRLDKIAHGPLRPVADQQRIQQELHLAVLDYRRVLQMAPGMFSVRANGPGLSDTKTFFRGFKDGYDNMTQEDLTSSPRSES
jgi:hypothetical protein